MMFVGVVLLHLLFLNASLHLIHVTDLGSFHTSNVFLVFTFQFLSKAAINFLRIEIVHYSSAINKLEFLVSCSQLPFFDGISTTSVCIPSSAPLISGAV